MSSKEEYKNYVLEQLSGIENVTTKKMMGEYLLYVNGILIGGIYDDRLLIKITPSTQNLNIEKAVPYEKAKPMFLIDFLDDKERLTKIIEKTYNALK